MTVKKKKRSRKKRSKGLVTKSNNLVEASYRLGVNEQRILAYVTSKIKTEEEGLLPMVFQVKDLMKMVGSKNRDMQILIRATEGLVTAALYIREPDGIRQTTWFRDVKYLDDGQVLVRFPDELAPHLTALKNRYVSYGIENILKLRSWYSIRIYDLLKHKEWQGKWEVGVDEFRAMLGLFDDEYTDWQSLRRRVLETAEKELPKKSDLAFTYTVEKLKRRVVKIRFVIKGKRAMIGKAGREAEDCFEKHNIEDTDCGAKWTVSRYEKCHWCKKFILQRAEENGQQSLFGDDLGSSD